VRTRIVWIDSDDVEFPEVAEFGAVELGQFAAEYEMEKLFLRSHGGEEIPES
jgi:hypothetical protein